MGEAAAEELAALSKGLIFFDVDTQRDFCWKNLGKDVYNPGAEKLAEKWGKLLGAARKARLRIFGDVDSHTEKDPELKRNGGRFDDHCFPLTHGWRHVPETEPQSALYVPNKALNKSEMASILMHDGEIYFEKQAHDVWDNQNTEAVLKAKGVKAAVVYGVATDYCVKLAVLGLQRAGIQAYVVTDAISAINIKPDDGKNALEEMKKAGAKFVKMEEVIRALNQPKLKSR